MQPNTAPNPQRFEVFTEIASGKGFKIKNSKYIYFFDKYGGWYDEFNNYYNADGQHEDPPSDEDDNFERVLLESEFYQEGDDDDHYDKIYGGTHVEQYDDYAEDVVEDDEDDYQPVVVKEKPVETKNESSNKKKYFAKNQASTESKKQEPKPLSVKQTQSPKKQVKPVQEKPKQDKKEPPKEEQKEPTWVKYQAEMTVFPKKDSFKEWMQAFGFSENEHFKNLTKVDSKEAKEAGRRFARVELRSDAFEKVQGKEYEKTKISFEKVN